MMLFPIGQDERIVMVWRKYDMRPTIAPEAGRAICIAFNRLVWKQPLKDTLYQLVEVGEAFRGARKDKRNRYCAVQFFWDRKRERVRWRHIPLSTP